MKGFNILKIIAKTLLRLVITCCFLSYANGAFSHDPRCGSNSIVFDDRPLDYNLYNNKLLEHVEKLLTDDGWIVERSNKSFNELSMSYPEIVCGHGHASVCSVFFCRKSAGSTKEISFVVKWLNNKWYVKYFNNV